MQTDRKRQTTGNDILSGHLLLGNEKLWVTKRGNAQVYLHGDPELRR